jgi:hypothetical protein
LVKLQSFCKRRWVKLDLSHSVSGGRKERTR